MKDKKLYVVGIGPGNWENMTQRAQKALLECDVIAGYTLYCELVRPYAGDREYITTPMMGEEKRVKLAFEAADSGKKVCLICSGDAGVYGLSSLACTLKNSYPEVELLVVPGVTAAVSGASLLGAPLTTDFCLISLSDHLTGWEEIEKRLRLAAEGDFVIVLYNPESKMRKGYLKRACGILLDIIDGDRICGIADNIGRDGEGVRVMTLQELSDAEADMFSTVFVGNSSTRTIDGMMVTPRGYESER